MKKVFALMLALMLIMAAAACKAPKPVDSVPAATGQAATTTQDNGDIQMTVKEHTIAGDAESIALTINNTSDKEYIYGAMFTIETEKDGHWEAVETVSEVFWDTAAYILNPGQSREETDWIENYYGTLASGNYRIVKVFTSEDGTNLTAYGAFAVK